MRYTRTIKHLFMVGIVAVMVSVPLFAQDTAVTAVDGSGILEKVGELMYFIVSLLSWLWIVLAAFAGKLMTNDLVFGGAFHMDYYLLQIWIIVKNLANFALGLGFIVFVARELWSGDVDMSSVVKQIGGFVLAGLLINFSFFIVQALVDISTIGVTAMGGMSSMFVSDQSSFGEDISEATARRTRTIFHTDGKTSTEVTKTDVSIPEMMDTILPKANSMAGPMVYLGANILNIQSFTLLYNATEESIDTMLQGKNLAVGFLIQLAIVGTFSLALFVLVIANIVRIGMIWILAALGPLFFLIWGLKRGGVNLPGGIDKIIGDTFKFSTFVELIFLPVFTTLMLSLALIFSTAVWSTLQSGELTEGGVTVDASDGATTVNEVIDLTYSGNFIGDSVKDVFADFIVAFVTIFLLWMIARYSIPTKTPIVGSMAKSLFDLAQKGAGSVGIIPIPGSDKKIGVSGIGALMSGNSSKGFSINPLAQGKQLTSKWKGDSQQDIQNMTNKWLGINTGSFVDEDIQLLERSLNAKMSNKEKLDNFFNTMKKRAVKKDTKGFQFRGERVFTDDILKKLQPLIKHATKNSSLPNPSEDNTAFYNNRIAMEYLLKKMSDAGFTYEGTKPTNLKVFKNTIFKK